MKILNLKFKNINSLSGENEIDFTNPVFTNDGLFAITGKTGAGKSSILDAISLAFYGKTPRVDITGSENAVMTKGEKDCFAEITFEVAGKKWKSSWKQERARTGTLKPVNRQIADFNNKIIADQVRSCDAEIIKILGLTFEQFTKVIMLAQGSFAAFLQADKNDKGQLLEQITGTEIYAEISKKVFERNRIEKDKLEKIAVELESIKVLSDEEIKNFTEAIIAFEKDKKLIDGQLQKLEISKKWLSDIENLQKQITDAKQKLPELEQMKNSAIEAFQKSENSLKTAKEEQIKLEPIFKKVSELDTKISEKGKLLQPILKVISELEKSENELSITLVTQNGDLKNSQLSLIEKEKWATENKRYEELVSDFSAIEKENQLLVASLGEIQKLSAEIIDLQKDLELKKTDAKKIGDIFTEKEKNLAEKLKELETKRTELAEILGGKELSNLQSEKEKISNFVILIKSIIDVENAIFTNQKELALFDEKIKQFEISVKELSEKIDSDKKIITNLESQIKLLDENIKLTQTIQRLEEHRHHLKDGEECPLCGSKEHPFALGNIPQIGEKETELAVLKKQHQEITNVIQQDEKKLAKLISDKDNNLTNRAKEEKNFLENSAKQKGILSEIISISSSFSIPKGDNKIEKLNEILTQKQDELKVVNAIIEKASNSEKQLTNLRDKEIPSLQMEMQNAEKLKTNAEIARKLAEQQFEEKQKIATISQERYKTESASHFKKLQIYGVENIDALKNCLNSWNENKKQREVLATQIATLNGVITLNNRELEIQTKALKEKQEEKQDIETQKQLLSNERKDIFAEKSVEEEENRLKKSLEIAETTKAKAEKEKADTNTEFEKYKAIVTEKEKELLSTQNQKITEKNTDQLQLEWNEYKFKSDEFSQKIGANHQTLKLNAENLKNSGNKLKEKEKQQAVCSKWGSLNELIGAADGKKYRNFAQSLTFEHLIGLSNRQLQKMSDRYILKRTGDTTNPFELYVIDKFQNSDERTAQNLSGGEKFIISLSLALGLANMASKNMRIDTMFIDEGFGTLDSDYLDVALNALSNLQSEGKVIGVISHLTELKERIATHVEVVPSGNGHSKIQITK